MFAAWVVLASFAYAAILFAIAWYGDRRPLYVQQPWLRPVVYSFALAVYCSSWTFYGAVGTAVRSGWGYLPIYLGRSEEHTSELQSRGHLVCRLLLAKKNGTRVAALAVRR